MIFRPTPVEGAYVVEMEPRGDERGYFARTWCRDEFAEHGLSTDFVQANTSFSPRQGTLRGLHYQVAPHGEDKLVRCIRGAIFDVFVDLRPDSPTYLQWGSVELTEASKTLVYVPKGCGHGFQTLRPNALVTYSVTGVYAPQAERGVRWDDPAIGVEWPAAPSRTISDKDRSWPDYTEERASGYSVGGDGAVSEPAPLALS